jgi:hypothetical protein
MRTLGLLAAVGALSVLTGPPVNAAPPQNVLIEVDVTVPPEGPSVGTFTATGPVCPSGSTTDIFARSAGFESERRVQILIGREFTCDDGSGTFLLLIRVHAEFEAPGSLVFVHPIPKTWSVLDGTGAFENLHGAGKGFGEPTAEGFFDTLTGRLQIQQPAR